MNPEQATQARFEATRWTLVIEARSGDADEALEQLCRIYWRPVYAFIRGQGLSPADAADLAQDFFAHVLRNKALSEVAPEKGKFRSFVQKSLSNFLNNARDRLRAEKRGGSIRFVPIDADVEEARHPLELADPSDLTKLFDRRWALCLLDEVMEELERNSTARGKGTVFSQLKPYLTGDLGEGAYATLSAVLNMTEGAVKTALHRMRREFGELLRIEIRHTLASPSEEDIRNELRHLLACLGD